MKRTLSAQARREAVAAGCLLCAFRGVRPRLIDVEASRPEQRQAEILNDRPRPSASPTPDPKES